ncbi:hypothetical protein V5O48_002558 [Marasmius crinis-equi]|uniref:Pentatricopeptide repeat-containing protein n=1 Tax=Marasmius crinis-equi TaxID=585013 RepID=A0ABR3FVC3_9AGAR
MSFRTGFLRVSHSSRRVFSLRIFSRPNTTYANSRIQRYAEALKARSNEADAITQYYPALVWEASQLESPSEALSQQKHPVSDDHLEIMLETLAASGRPSDLKQIEAILADMSDVFDNPPTPRTHTAIIRGLLRCQRDLTVMRWFQTMPEKPGGIRPTLEHYHMLLDACPTFTSFKNMRNVVEMMLASGCLPTNETYRLLLRGLWELSDDNNPPPPSHIARTLQEMKERGLDHEPAFLSFLSNEYAKRGLTKWADDIAALYNEILSSHVDPEKTIEDLWVPRFSAVAARQGLEDALALYPDFVSQGGKPSSRIFNSLLRHSCTVEDMQTISKALDMQPTRAQWSMMISLHCQRGRVQTALDLYDQARAAGVDPYAPMNGSLIKGLFRNSSKPFPDGVLDRALELYDDLNKTAPIDAPMLNQITKGAHAEGPDIDIYTELFHGLSLAQSGGRYTAAVKALTEDMQARGIEVFSASASIAVMRIRTASNEEEAYQEYQRRRSTLNETGYERVLDAFCYRSLGGRISVPSISRYFSIVKDMRRAGFEVTDNVYTTILRHFGRLGTRTQRYADYEHLRPKLVRATRRIHDLITLDAAISPGPPLWNQLMDTYQRLGCFGDSYRVWNQMYISKTYDHLSLSILFDACGYGQMGHLAEETMTRMKRDGYELTVHNWNSYIEALCRVGKLNNALKALCLDMAGDVRPTPETIMIIRSFAKAPGLDGEIMNRIKRYHPQLYESIASEKP